MRSGLSGTARAAGIVLAGGRSSRMGTSKAALDWFGVPLLARVAGLVGRAVDGPVVVVRAPGRGLPPLPARVEVVDDPVDHPHVGGRSGLRGRRGDLRESSRGSVGGLARGGRSASAWGRKSTLS